jgi:hypothetical protein
MPFQSTGKKSGMGSKWTNEIAMQAKKWCIAFWLIYVGFFVKDWKSQNSILDGKYSRRESGDCSSSTYQSAMILFATQQAALNHPQLPLVVFQLGLESVDVGRDLNHPPTAVGGIEKEDSIAFF